MKSDYAPRTCVPLSAGTLVENPPDKPELVHLHDPAVYVYTDFSHNRPVVIRPDDSIDTAMNQMKASGVHSLLVLDEAGAVVGQITANDILGDVPIRLAESDGLDHSKISVEMVMTPREKLKVLECSHLRDARVGHVVATMHYLETRYLLVVEEGRVCGLFSMTDISRYLGHDISETAVAAHSLAEIVHELG